MTKSNVIAASCVTSSTICATFNRARTDDKNRDHPLSFNELESGNKI